MGRATSKIKKESTFIIFLMARMGALFSLDYFPCDQTGDEEIKGVKFFLPKLTINEGSETCRPLS